MAKAKKKRKPQSTKAQRKTAQKKTKTLPAKSKGVANRRETKGEVVLRRAAVLRMFTKGYSIDEMAEFLGNKKDTIRSDVDHWNTVYLHRMQAKHDQHRAEQLARLDVIEQEAYAAWQASQKPTIKTEETQTEKGSLTKRSSTTTSGNPQFLRIMIDVARDKARLLGLDAKDDEEQDVLEVPLTAVIVATPEEVEQGMNWMEFQKKLQDENTVDGKVVK